MSMATAAEDGWFFANPRAEARRTSLNEQARADLQRYYLSRAGPPSKDQARPSDNQQPHPPTDIAPAGRRGGRLGVRRMWNTGGDTGTADTAPSSSALAANPLLGVGEKMLATATSVREPPQPPTPRSTNVQAPRSGDYDGAPSRQNYEAARAPGRLPPVTPRQPYGMDTTPRYEQPQYERDPYRADSARVPHAPPSLLPHPPQTSQPQPQPQRYQDGYGRGGEQYTAAQDYYAGGQRYQPQPPQPQEQAYRPYLDYQQQQQFYPPPPHHGDYAPPPPHPQPYYQDRPPQPMMAPQQAPPPPRVDNGAAEYRRELERQIQMKKEREMHLRAEERAEDQRYARENRPYNNVPHGGGNGQQQQRQVSMPAAADSFDRRPSELPPISSTTSTAAPASTYGRGASNMDSLPEWQREEILRKRQKYQEAQLQLKQQMQEAADQKRERQMKEKALQREEEARVERERQELEERYRAEEARAAAEKAAAELKKTAESGGGGDAGMTKEQARERAKEEARQLFLKAQAEAEELKKAKFKAKRETAGALRAGAADTDTVTGAADVVARPSPFTVRAASPPLPAARRKSSAPLSVDQYGADSLPPSSAPSALPPIAHASHHHQPAMSGGVSQQQRQQQLQSAPAQLAAPTADPLLAFQLDLKTRAVLDQLSAIKQELDREREQIRHELDRQKQMSMEQQQHQQQQMIMRGYPTAVPPAPVMWYPPPPQVATAFPPASVPATDLSETVRNHEERIRRQSDAMRQLRDQMKSPQPQPQGAGTGNNAFRPQDAPINVDNNSNHTTENGVHYLRGGHEAGEELQLHSTTKHMPMSPSQLPMRSSIAPAVAAAPTQRPQDDDTLSVLFGPHDLRQLGAQSRSPPPPSTSIQPPPLPQTSLPSPTPQQSPPPALSPPSPQPASTATPATTTAPAIKKPPPPITGFRSTNSIADLATLQRINQARKARLTELGISPARSLDH